MLESLFNTAAGLLASNFIKKRLHHRRFLVNMAKYLRTSMIEGFFLAKIDLLGNARKTRVYEAELSQDYFRKKVSPTLGLGKRKGKSNFQNIFCDEVLCAQCDIL